MYELLKDFEKQTNCSIVEMGHAYRINGVIDIWKRDPKVFFIEENKYQNFKNHALALNSISLVLSSLGTKDAYKKAKNGMTWKEFKNNTSYNQTLEAASFNGEDYHWKQNIDKVGTDDLYFLIIDNAIKIGRSKDPRKRISSNRTMLPSGGTLYYFSNKGFLEKILHGCFKEYKKTGEWFQNTFRIRNFIAKYHQHQINGDTIVIKPV